MNSKGSKNHRRTMKDEENQSAVVLVITIAGIGILTALIVISLHAFLFNLMH